MKLNWQKKFNGFLFPSKRKIFNRNWPTKNKMIAIREMQEIYIFLTFSLLFGKLS